MADIFGVDFGTTNSVAACIGLDPAARRLVPRVLNNREDGRPHPSVLWYTGDAVVAGRAAKSRITDFGHGVLGDCVRSPKMLLGSPCGVNVAGTLRSCVDVVADFLAFMRRDAEDRGFRDQTFERAVMTIPVTMDGRARGELRQAALKAGVMVHQFVHEPLAALYGYLRGQEFFQREFARLEHRLMLVFDWGGGTLDLTLVQLEKGVLTQILNVGDRTVGGDEFDNRILKLVQDRHALAYPNADWRMLQASAWPRLVEACEDAKIALSERTDTTVFVRDVLAVEGPARHVQIQLTRDDLVAVTHDLVGRGLGMIDRLLGDAGIPRNALEFCLATGGMVAMPAIGDGLRDMFGINRLRVAERSATVIAEGAAWIAHDGAVVRLAKPLEMVHVGENYLPLLEAGQELPTGGRELAMRFLLYCVDPRDGFAKFHFVRPRWPGRLSMCDQRVPYGSMVLPVDHHARPFQERLNLDLAVDHNQVIQVTAQAEGRGASAQFEILDMEFGISLPVKVQRPDGTDGVHGAREAKVPLAPRPRQDQAVVARGNVTNTEDQALVPGDLAGGCYRWESLTTKQQRDFMYYRPCVECGKTSFQVAEEGCDKCAALGRAPSRAEALRRCQERKAQQRKAS